MKPDEEFNIYQGKTEKQIKLRERKILLSVFIIVFIVYCFGLYSYFTGEISIKGNVYSLVADPGNFYFTLVCMLLIPTIGFLGAVYRYHIIISMYCQKSD
ncbi:hypothetical protein J7384_18905 [Endozoicomonas sp. G2_1]|uniref:hypothetical protein n=1 Tax=Endozoicomonas sp. G2_1 TaxID=2821091 RepID=UPI001AD9C89C|nr:hypothetical protein [Endozoicomonas sp. G2_1]MBO9492439.1 hypothetical protein [Endozoicomonas sp. G2_1]